MARMKIDDFKLEVFFSKYEFNAPYLLAQSDCESLTVAELLAYEPGAEERLLSGWLGYSETEGSPVLRGLIAELYETMKPEDVLMHAGAQEAVFAFMNVALSSGDHVITMTPAYQSLYTVAQAVGCEVSDWRLRPDGKGRWLLDFDELKNLIKPNTKVIVVNTPNNPTGYTLTTDEIDELIAIANTHGLYIFSDEVYRGLNLDGEKRPWLADIYDRAISLGVLSKAYGFAGLRLGWVATKDKDLLDKMGKYKHYLSICNSVPSELLGEVVLRHGEALINRSLEIIKRNLAIGDAFFAKYPERFTNYRPQCGSVAFQEIKLTDESIGEFCEKLVAKAGVLLLPASVYDYDGSFVRMGYGRISYGECLARLEDYLVKERYV